MATAVHALSNHSSVWGATARKVSVFQWRRRLSSSARSQSRSAHLILLSIRPLGVRMNVFIKSVPILESVP